MDYFYYLCSMMTKNLYINIVDLMRNTLVTNILYQHHYFVIGIKS